MTKCVATAVMRIRGSSGSGAWPLPHAFEFEKLLALIVRGLDGTILPKDRSGELIHGVRYCGGRSLAENGRRGDLRPLAGSGRRAVRGPRLLGCSTFLHRSKCNPDKPRSADAPHSQRPWSALDAGPGASQFLVTRYLEEIQRVPMLEPHEEYMLAKRWREHGDHGAAHKLVNSHLRLVARIARGHRGYGLPISEL